MSEKKDPKEKLADTFIALSSREGAYRLTLEAVAKHAKMPFSTAHYHLKSSELSLVELAVRRVGTMAQAFIQTYLGRVAQSHSDENPLHSYIRGTYAWAQEYPTHASLWLFQYHLIAVNKRARQDHQVFLDAAALRIEGLVYLAFGRGCVKGNPPTPSREQVGDLTIAIHSLLIGSLTRALTSADIALDLHEAAVLKSVDRLLESFRIQD